jgi:hypothetical protein
MDQIVAPVEHFHYDVFRGVKAEADSRNELEGTRVTFSYGPNGQIDRFGLELEPSLPDTVFMRKAEAQRK